MYEASDVGAESMKGVRRRSRKASRRVGIESSAGWAERNDGKGPKETAFTTRTRSYGNQCEPGRACCASARCIRLSRCPRSVAFSFVCASRSAPCASSFALRAISYKATSGWS
eukprot:31184-Pelagococcus_subviridis.AAC.5